VRPGPDDLRRLPRCRVRAAITAQSCSRAPPSCAFGGRLGFPASDTIADAGPAVQHSLSQLPRPTAERKVNIFRLRPSCPGSRIKMEGLPVDNQARTFGADMHHRRGTGTCRQRSLMRLSLGSWPGWSRGSPLANSGSWLPWPMAFGGVGWSRSSGSAPGEAATSAMRAGSAMPEPGSLHPAVLALLSRGSLTASSSLRRHLARKA